MNDVLSAKDLMRFGMRNYKEVVDYNWHGKIIKIKYMLSREEMLNLIHDIENMCITESGNFIPGLLDFSIRLNVVSNYAYVELPDNMDDIYNVLYHSDIYDAVASNINQSQKNAILNCFGR